MLDVTNKVIIPLDKPATRVVIPVKQNNKNSRRIIFTLTQNGSVYDIADVRMAAVRGTKPDGNSIYNDCIIKGNQLIYEVTSQTIAATGRVTCELVLFGDNREEIVSADFIIEVYPQVFGEGVIESSNEYNVLEYCVEACNEERNKAEQAAERAEASREAAEQAGNSAAASLEKLLETAQENVIETVKVNGTEITPEDKAVDIKVPTKVSALENDEGYVGRNNPVFTGTLSVNRKAGETKGNYSSTLGYVCVASGEYSHAECYLTKAIGNKSHAEGEYARAEGIASHAEGCDTLASKDMSHAEGASTKATGYYSHAEGSGTEASGEMSHAEGGRSIASGLSSHAEGSGTEASGNQSHAEGGRSIASGLNSHAEGNGTEASGEMSHTEGHNTTASGNVSHAEGRRTTASGECSHAEGYYTRAASDYQHVQGRYNAIDVDGEYIHIVGNGNGSTPEQRSNAHTLDWEGNAWYAGDVEATDKDGNGVSLVNHTHSKSQIEDFPTSMPASDVPAWAKEKTKPSYTKSEVGLGNVDNTADADKPVSAAQRQEIYYSFCQSNAYTDDKIAELIDGAPETMDTIKEVADAIAEHKDVETALNEAIGKKANQTELDTHTENDDIHTTVTEKSNWNDASSKKHSHSNKLVLDGITSALITAWNKVADKVDKTGDASNVTNTITAAANRTNLTTGEKLSISLGKISKWFSDLKTVAFSGSYKDLSDTPTLGTAAGKDIAVSGNASTAQVVMGNDTRLTNARKASDVYAWAKEKTKPSYTKSEVGLGNVDNTADADKPVSAAQRQEIYYSFCQSNAYTDDKIAELIDGAPETMDTIKEVADAIAEHKDVETALNEAVGKKANQEELNAHTGNEDIHVTAGDREKIGTAYEQCLLMSPHLADLDERLENHTHDEYVQKDKLYNGLPDDNVMNEPDLENAVMTPKSGRELYKYFTQEIDNLKSYASDGKKMVSDAIAGTGLGSSSSDTFEKMAADISDILHGNATEQCVVKDMVFSSDYGRGLIGTIPTVRHIVTESNWEYGYEGDYNSYYVTPESVEVDNTPQGFAIIKPRRGYYDGENDYIELRGYQIVEGGNV